MNIHINKYILYIYIYIFIYLLIIYIHRLPKYNKKYL